MTPAEHYAAAEELLRQSTRQGLSYQDLAVIHSAAQVHATLATLSPHCHDAPGPNT